MEFNVGHYGYQSVFDKFVSIETSEIISQLKKFVPDYSDGQFTAWKESIPMLKSSANQAMLINNHGKRFHSILEYQIPMEFRRIDAVFLLGNHVLVIEFKGKVSPLQSDLDQASAYGRDLRNYHGKCHDVPVKVVVIPTRSNNILDEQSNITICSPDRFDKWVSELSKQNNCVMAVNDFLDDEAYQPLPSLIKAARDLFVQSPLPRIKTASAATDPCIDSIKNVILSASRLNRRKLILVTGVPGSGKTLVGLRIAHEKYLDDIAKERKGKPTRSPAVFLSGNGPLVEVLQYELKRTGGDGKAFVRDVKSYVNRYSNKPNLIPSEHVLIYDEAQRAWDAKRVSEKHKHPTTIFKSEPEHFIEFAERIPGWSTIIALIGSGQEIHIGEEGGVSQWSEAINHSSQKNNWDVSGPNSLSDLFEGINYHPDDNLTLDVSLRSHLSLRVHDFVGSLISNPISPENILNDIHKEVEKDGFAFRITRDLLEAKSYMQNRYADNPDARFGLIASSRDKILNQFGVMNDWQNTKNIRVGPWYSDSEGQDNSKSCRLMKECVTEFSCQGLELDGAILCWGSDFILKNRNWDISLMRKYKNGSDIRDPWALRSNAYRVLLTRARDVTVIFLPPDNILDETYDYLINAGFKKI